MKTIPNLYPVGTFMVQCHLLVEDAPDGTPVCTLIDSGLFLEKFTLMRTLRRLGLPLQSIRRVLLTHGHLDHTGNLAWIKRKTGAEILIHREDELHLAQQYPYLPPNRVCQRLEKLGSRILCWKPVTADGFLEDGQIIDAWGGLEVLHLPGHTAGHCCFYSARHKVLFLGDLLAVYSHSTHHPHRVLNSEPEKLMPSLRKALDREIDAIIPNHYDRFNPPMLTQKVREFVAAHSDL